MALLTTIWVGSRVRCVCAGLRTSLAHLFSLMPNLWSPPPLVSLAWQAWQQVQTHTALWRARYALHALISPLNTKDSARHDDDDNNSNSNSILNNTIRIIIDTCTSPTSNSNSGDRTSTSISNAPYTTDIHPSSNSDHNKHSPSPQCLAALVQASRPPRLQWQPIHHLWWYSHPTGPTLRQQWYHQQ